MKKRIVYNEQVKTLMLTVEAIRSYGGLPKEVAKKAEDRKSVGRERVSYEV